MANIGKQAQLSTSAALIIHDRYGLPMAVVEAPAYARTLAELYVAKFVKNGTLLTTDQKVMAATLKIFNKQADPVAKFIVHLCHGLEIDLRKTDLHMVQQASIQIDNLVNQSAGKATPTELALTSLLYKEMFALLTKYRKMKVGYFSAVNMQLYGFTKLDNTNGMTAYL